MVHLWYLYLGLWCIVRAFISNHRWSMHGWASFTLPHKSFRPNLTWPFRTDTKYQFFLLIQSIIVLPMCINVGDFFLLTRPFYVYFFYVSYWEDRVGGSWEQVSFKRMKNVIVLFRPFLVSRQLTQRHFFLLHIRMYQSCSAQQLSAVPAT